jgi:hypothetical protein
MQRRPGMRGLERTSGDGAWCAVLACLTPRMHVMAARPQALIAAISDLLPTMLMTRVRL